MTPHGAQHEDAGAYVIGCLDPDERSAFEAHLSTCDECAAEVRSFRTVNVALACSAPQQLPPPELRLRPVARWTRSWLPLAATLIVAVAAGVYAASLQIRVGSLEALVAASDLVRIDLAGQPAAPQARGRALWSRARGMVFISSGLPPLPAGQTYQVWVVTGPGPVSAGLLTPDLAGGGLIFFETPPDIPPPTAVAVTIEPAGGLPAPTGAFYLVGSPAGAL